jgi:hypothetical protein
VLRGLLALSLLLMAAAPGLTATINVPGDYSTIQGAIDAAVDGDTILVGPGTYNEYVRWYYKDLQVIGAGPDVTTIDCLGQRCMYIYQVPETARLEGFTFTGGTWAAAGVYAGYSALTIAENVFEGNNASNVGGGQYIYQ